MKYLTIYPFLSQDILKTDPMNVEEGGMKFFERRLEKKTCIDCKERKARCKFRNRGKWDAGHKLCMRCWRSVIDSQRELLRRERYFGFPSATAIGY